MDKSIKRRWGDRRDGRLVKAPGLQTIMGYLLPKRTDCEVYLSDTIDATALVAYLEDVPVLGVPAAGMYFKNTLFDRMLPMVFADVEIQRSDIVAMGVGGLIMNNERYTVEK